MNRKLDDNIRINVTTAEANLYFEVHAESSKR